MTVPSEASASAFDAREAKLRERVAAWRECWRDRARTTSASTALLMSQTLLGEPVAARLETRLLEGRRAIDNALARCAGEVAAAIAKLCRDAPDVAAIERRVHEDFLRQAKTDETFENRLAELAPLVALHRRLAIALGETG